MSIENTQIRARKSYKMFKRFMDAGAGKDVLEMLHTELDIRSAYRSQKNSNYARESLDLLLKDYGGA